MGVAAIRAMFEKTRAEGRVAFLPYLTAGLPDPGSSPRLFAVMAEAGADGFEVGIPYSDPLMDGPIIQHAGEKAIAAGTTLDTAFDILGDVKAATQRPVFAMTYANPVFRRGVEAFSEALGTCGADAVIVPDLPVEESMSLRQATSRRGLGLVQFVAPTSDARRIQAVAASDPAFIYAVAEMGVTGERTSASEHTAALVERIRRATSAPIVFGVGISTAEHALAAAEAGADGVIMGTAVVRRVLEADGVGAAEAALAELVTGVVGALSTG